VPIFVRTGIDPVGKLIRFVPAAGSVVLKGGCRSVSGEAHTHTIVEPIDIHTLNNIGRSPSHSSSRG